MEVKYMMLKKILKHILPNPFEGVYNIGFIPKKYINSCRDWYRGVQWIDTNGFEKDGWFADPFFYGMDDCYFTLLAEQWYYPINRGRLVKLIISRDYKLINVIPILTLDSHLSFPNIWREGGKTYVYPENCQGGTLSMWEFDGDKMYNPRILISEPLIDSQIVKLKDEYFVFAVRFQTGDWTETQQLQIWRSKDLFGPYELIQTIKNIKNHERGAGEVIIVDENTIIRPAQNCEGAYGKEVLLYKMVYDGNQFTEHEFKRISPLGGCKFGEVLHSFNIHGNMCVIDGFAHHHKILYNLLKKTIYHNKQV